MEFYDGQKIGLAYGWTLVVVDREDGVLQGFVEAPNKRDSASLQWAIEIGATSGEDEVPIPKAVLKQLEKYEDHLA